MNTYTMRCRLLKKIRRHKNKKWQVSFVGIKNSFFLHYDGVYRFYVPLEVHTEYFENSLFLLGAKR